MMKSKNNARPAHACRFQSSREAVRDLFLSVLVTSLVCSVAMGSVFGVGDASAVAPSGGSAILRHNPSGIETPKFTTSEPLYTPGQLYGQADAATVCYTCEASEVTGSAPPSESLAAGTGVDTLTGDFSTSNSLFNISGAGSGRSLALTYDAELAQSEVTADAPGQFGYGWTSSVSPTLTLDDGTSPWTLSVNEGNGTEEQYTQSPSSGTSTSCTGTGYSGDYPDTDKFTLGGSADQWCALASVRAQIFNGTGDEDYQYENWYTRTQQIFNWDGSLSEQLSLTQYGEPTIVIRTDISPGSSDDVATCPDSAASCTFVQAWSDDVEEADEVEVLNSAGQVVQIIDPAGVTYDLGYDTHGNLTSVEDYANQSTPSTWNYAYDTGQASPRSSDLIKIEDPDYTSGTAHTTSIAYNNSGSDTGMISSLTDGTGAETTYTYDDACSEGQCVGTGDPQQTTITYPAQVPSPGATAVSPVEVDSYVGGVESSTSLGSTSDSYDNETWQYNWTFGYGSANSTEVITYPDSLSGASLTATVTLDPAGNVIQTENTLGDYASSAFDDAGDNNLPELMWSYPGESSNSYSDPPSGSYVYTYTDIGEVQTATDPLGNVTNYGYYGDGDLCYVAQPSIAISGTPPSCADYGWDGPGGDAPTESTAFSYDDDGNLISASLDYNDTATGADPQTTTANYNAMGDLLWSIPPAGQSGSQSSSNPYATVDTYTPANLLATETPPGEGTTTNSYDAALNLLTQATPAATTTYSYDGDNRGCYAVVASSAVSGLSCSTAYQEGSTATSYVPGSSNIYMTTDSLGHVTTYYYGDLAYPNEPTEEVDAADDAVQYSAYNDFGTVCVSGDESVASQQGTSTQCSSVTGDTKSVFNSLGDETSIIDPNGNTTTNAFTNTAYPTQETSTENALSQTTSHSYNADGELVTTTNPDSTTVKRSYDADGRLCTTSDNGTSYACGSGTDVSGVTSYSYNGASDRTATTTYSPAAATTTYSYTNGELTTTTDSNAKTLSYLYNHAGQVICEAYPIDVTMGCGTISLPASGSPTNTIVTRAYDSAGRLHTVTDWMSTNNTTTYTYGDAWTPNTPTSVASAGATADYGYNNNGEPSSLTEGSVISDSWTYDNDQREATTEVNSSTSASTAYNSNSQITAATNLGSSTSNDAYSVAANGEITKDVPPSGTTTSFAYNAGGELCWSADVSSTASCTSPPSASIETNFTYTTNGERASAATTTGSGTTTTDYAWNPYGELCNVSSTTTSCGSAPANGSSYTYNGDGLRTTTTSTSTSTSPQTISAVGSLQNTSGAGNSSLSVDPQHVGDVLVFSAGIFTGVGVDVASVSGGGATWHKITNTDDETNGIDSELWLGTVTTTGSSTITVTYSTGVSTVQIDLSAQEYSSSAGASTNWAVVNSGHDNNEASSSTVTYPSLTASTSGELYVGFGGVQNYGEAGSTSGFTYDVTPGMADLYISNPDVTGTVSPTGDESPAGYSDATGAIIEATGTSSPSTTTTDSTWDSVAGGSVPLNVDDATTSGSSATNVSYVYGDLLFGGTAPIEQITTTSSGSTAVFLVANQTGVQGVFSSSGATKELAVYSPYGEQKITSGSDVTPFGFQGSYTDLTGLIYLINRYYDPTTDQFLSIDPDVATTDQPYVFTNDNPLNAEDPLGEDPSLLGNPSQYPDQTVPVVTTYTSGPIALDTDPMDGSGAVTGMPFGDIAPPAAGAGSEGTGGSGGEIPGLASDYTRITFKGSVENVQTNVTPKEFGENLKEAGWNEEPKDGATLYTKGGATYSVYPVSDSTGGPTASYTPRGSSDVTLKIRLGR